MKFLVIALALLAVASAQRTQFFAYTRDNPFNATEVTRNDISNSFMTPTILTKFVVHGFSENSQDPWMILMKDELLTRAAYNVILVDYAGLANDDQRAGTEIAEFYDFLVTQGYSTGDMHCIGYNQGAHVCGFSGKRVIAGTLNRISGLDMARADKYNINDTTSRLHNTDADVVDCTHTDGGNSGMIEAVCDADFYPNGGTSTQPGCGPIEINGICSHRRAQEYYTESVQSTNFQAWQCDTYDNFLNGLCAGNLQVTYGLSMPLTTLGTYYFNTNRSPPYACGTC